MSIEANVRIAVLDRMCIPTAHAAASIRSLVEMAPSEVKRYFAYRITTCRECDIVTPEPPEETIAKPTGRKYTPNSRPTLTSRRTARRAGSDSADVGVREILRSNLVRQAYEGAMAALYRHLRQPDVENPAAEEFFQEFRNDPLRRTPILYWSSCRVDDRLKTLLCQLESDVHLGVLGQDLGGVGTSNSHVINGRPDGIDAAKDFAEQKYLEREQEILNAVLQTEP